MYGIGNRALRDLVIKDCGQGKFKGIAPRSDFQVDEIIPLKSRNNLFPKIRFMNFCRRNVVVVLSRGAQDGCFPLIWKP